MSAYWVTFYSYKGGVGRSMALANVAALLAQEGRRVLLIDFDLEAPGLDSFKEFGLKPGSKGVVEYVAYYISRRSADSSTMQHLQVISPIAEHVQEVSPEGKPLRGKLWVMPSGAKDKAYNALRATINWDSLYDKFDGEAFIENWKADIEQTFAPDYVFIDSRTGLTDVGGVCTLHFPSLVVLLFGLNDQNIQGIASVARVLRDSPSAPQLLPVATPVPDVVKEAGDEVANRLECAEDVLGVKIANQIHYYWPVSLGEQIFTWRGDSSILTDDYRILRDAILAANPKGIDALIRQSKEATQQFDEERSKEICFALERGFADRADAWYAIADASLAFRRPEAAEAALVQTLELDPNHLRALEQAEMLMRSLRHHELLLNLVTTLTHRVTSVGRRWSLYNIQGELFMREQRYGEALHSYEEMNRSVQSDKQKQLSALFNRAEAARRHRKMVMRNHWREVVAAYESMAAGFSSDSPALRANRTQAMHMAYAVCGPKQTALDLLSEAEDLLRHLSPGEKIFCVAVYDIVTLDEFREWNRKMFEAVRDRGQLWDGMALPIA